MRPAVRDHIPLEQGLRLPTPKIVIQRFGCQRPYSIRTRIKTKKCKVIHTDPRCQRPYSIRTRIKTYLLTTALRKRLVRDHIPLEQGLRLDHKSDATEKLESETIFH